MIPKFRVFDKKYKKIMKVNEINFEKSSVWIESDSGDHENRHTLTRGFDEVILMQSTGLHDDQGVEIFEGDIVNVDRTFRNPMTGSGTLTLNKNFEVVFINGMFTRDGSSMGLSKDLKYLTVIGNVHQHPELLEDV